MLVILSGCEKEDPLKTITYTASAGSGGTISPEGSVLITQGEDMTFTATPNYGKIVNEWTVNGNVVATSANTYTVTNVQSDGTIQVTFKDYIVWQLTPTMTAVLDDKGVLTISTTKDAEEMPWPKMVPVNGGSAWSYLSHWIKDEIDYRDKILSAVIKDKVTLISAEAFAYNCSALTSVSIPNSVTTIKFAAFAYCTSLTSVTIPNSVKTIEDYTFSECKALTSVVIPNSVTTIDLYAFSHCTALTSITIPSSVTSLGGSILYDCTGLKDVKVGWMTPPSNGLGVGVSSATLHVPTGTKALYQASPAWNLSFRTIVEY